MFQTFRSNPMKASSAYFYFAVSIEKPKIAATIELNLT